MEGHGTANEFVAQFRNGRVGPEGSKARFAGFSFGSTRACSLTPIA